MPGEVISVRVTGTIDDVRGFVAYAESSGGLTAEVGEWEPHPLRGQPLGQFEAGAVMVNFAVSVSASVAAAATFEALRSAAARYSNNRRKVEVQELPAHPGESAPTKAPPLAENDAGPDHSS